MIVERGVWRAGAVGICMGAEEAGWQGPSIMSIIYLALSVLALGLVAEKASRRSGMMYVESRLTWSSASAKMWSRAQKAAEGLKANQTVDNKWLKTHWEGLPQDDTALKTDKFESMTHEAERTWTMLLDSTWI